MDVGINKINLGRKKDEEKDSMDKQNFNGNRFCERNQNKRGEFCEHITDVKEVKSYANAGLDSAALKNLRKLPDTENNKYSIYEVE